MKQSQHASNRLLWAIVGFAVIVLLVAVITALSMMGVKKDAATPLPSEAPRVATKDKVRQNIALFDASMKQATLDQAAAKTALADSKNQIKVGS